MAPTNYYQHLTQLPLERLQELQAFHQTKLKEIEERKQRCQARVEYYTNEFNREARKPIKDMAKISAKKLLQNIQQNRMDKRYSLKCKVLKLLSNWVKLQRMEANQEAHQLTLQLIQHHLLHLTNTQKLKVSTTDNQRAQPLVQTRPSAALRKTLARQEQIIQAAERFTKKPKP